MDRSVEIQMLEEQLEEEQWLRQDEAATHGSGHSGRVYQAISLTAVAYLLLNAVSVRTPGPAHWLGLASHVHLIGHVQGLF